MMQTGQQTETMQRIKPKTLYTVKEFLALGLLSAQAIYKMCADGRIPSVKIGSKVFIKGSYVRQLLGEE